MLVRNHPSATHAGIRRHHHFRLRIVNAQSQACRGEAAKYHRVDSAQSHAGEHGKDGFGNHRHVDQHDITLADTEIAQHGGAAHHLLVQFGVCVSLLSAGLGRDIHQRLLVAAHRQMAIDRVVAKIGFAPDKPARKRRIVILEDTIKRFVPIDELCLFRPEIITVFNGSTVELLVFFSHSVLSQLNLPLYRSPIRRF